MGNRKKFYEVKRIKPKGEKKKRPCLGPDCDAVFETTPDVRICPNCKQKISFLSDAEVYSVAFNNGKNREE